MEYKNLIYDVIIIGGGPAGCSSALELANKNLKVLVLEKQKRGREKVCGDGIIDDSIEILKYFGIYEDFLKISYEISSLNLHFKNLFEKIPVKHFTCERKVFDNFLHKKIFENGIKILYNSKVTSLEKSKKFWKVKINSKTLTSKKIILATGFDYSLAKSVGFKFKDNSSYFAIRNYCKNSINLKGYNFYFFKKLKGYCWAFPIKDGRINFGVFFVEKTKNAKLHLENFISFMEEKYSKKLEILDRSKGALLRTNLSQKELSKNDIFIVGENANTTYDLSGEGIGKAMLSGILASKVIHKRKNLKSYDKKLLKLKVRYIRYKIFSFLLFKVSLSFIYFFKLKFFKLLFKKTFLEDKQENLLTKN